jgi:hypothetical protein
MQRQSKISFISLFGILLFLVTTTTMSFAQNNEKFRTPAKLYAGAYSVKAVFKRDFTDYDVPVWIKPDQAESTIDLSLLKDLGYPNRVGEFEQVKISNEVIGKLKFKNMKSEWAYVPDYAKSCCYGVIGRDILQNFELRFDPTPPAHLEWTRIINNEKKPSHIKPAFMMELKKLFSLSQVNEIPYVLNLQNQKLEFEGVREKVQPGLFSFTFVPPARILRVTGVLPKEASSAKKVGLTAGTLITEINGENVAELDRWQIEKYLRGEKADLLKITSKANKSFVFDFKKHEFN